ncbi:CPBP family intramembrane glutamic endopeptidase [Pseudotamlana agarivorans]|uniref:CPBP family intramembrane glutamic endopeptidase n=1 Tax=Pseudotamlana agarivorans TaxID=481183 RepID=UPI001FDF34B2|nr:type II CAAX endopeptidase family protein [Tamlana agarivorans]
MKTKLIPILAFIISMVLLTVPLGLNQFQTILPIFIVIVASVLEFGKSGFKFLGFKSKRFNVFNLLILAPMVALGLFLLYFYILIPVITHFTKQPLDFSHFEALKGNGEILLSMLLLIWTSVAFGEEMIFRGYFMNQFVKFFGESRWSIIGNILFFGVLFGWVHSYQGLTGQIITGLVGMLLAIIFYFRKYDLWFNIAVHGFFDTIALVVLYNGWL